MQSEVAFEGAGVEESDVPGEAGDAEEEAGEAREVVELREKRSGPRALPPREAAAVLRVRVLGSLLFLFLLLTPYISFKE